MFLLKQKGRVPSDVTNALRNLFKIRTYPSFETELIAKPIFGGAISPLCYSSYPSLQYHNSNYAIHSNDSIVLLVTCISRSLREDKTMNFLNTFE